MPKLPRVSGADVVKALGRLGFVVARQRGSHIVMRRGASGCVLAQCTLCAVICTTAFGEEIGKRNRVIRENQNLQTPKGRETFNLGFAAQSIATGRGYLS